MAKHKTIEDNESINSSNSVSNVKKYEQSVWARHRDNSTVEYKINNEYITFCAYERKKLNLDIINSNDFKKCEKNFVIEEVKEDE